MIEMRPKSEDMQAAAMVAANVNINSINLLSVKADSYITSDELAQCNYEMKIDFLEPEYKLFDETHQLRAMVGLLVKLCGVEQKSGDCDLSDNPEDEKTYAAIELRYRLIYDLPRTPVPEEVKKTGIPAFAEINALYHCWPYFRQEMQSLISGMGLPSSIVLPVLQVKPRSATSLEEEESAGKKLIEKQIVKKPPRKKRATPRRLKK